MPRDPEEQRLLDEILERVDAIHALRKEREPEFVPGKSPVRYAGRVYDQNEMRALVDSSVEFWLTSGRYHRKLERELAKKLDANHARLVNSGSSANLVATASLMSPLFEDRRVRPGDEVITVAGGFPTTVTPALQLGMRPVFVDLDIPTYNIDVSALEEARSDRTRAVMIAHSLGNPFDLDTITAFCKEHDLWLVEDNCDAFGSLYDGKLTGTFGDLATLSFYPPHHITCGEGGAVLCNDDLMQRVVESIRDWGRDCWCPSGVDNTCGKRFDWQLGDLPRGYDHKYTYSHLGFNLKMTDMQAAVGFEQLKKVDAFIDARKTNWRFYREELADLEEFFVLPEPTPKSDPSWFGFMMMIRDDAPFTRAELVSHLESRKIQTRMLFAGNLIRQPALTRLREDRLAQGDAEPYRVVGTLENTDAVMERAFWFGVYPGLTEESRAYVSDEIRAFVEERRKAPR